MTIKVGQPLRALELSRNDRFSGRSHPSREISCRSKLIGRTLPRRLGLPPFVVNDDGPALRSLPAQAQAGIGLGCLERPIREAAVGNGQGYQSRPGAGVRVARRTIGTPRIASSGVSFSVTRATAPKRWMAAKSRSKSRFQAPVSAAGCRLPGQNVRPIRPPAGPAGMESMRKGCEVLVLIVMVDSQAGKSPNVDASPP